MATVMTDVLQTRLDIIGLGGYVAGLESAAAALGLVDVKTSAAARRQMAFGLAAGAASLGIAAALKEAVLQAGKFQQVQMGFKSTLGSEEAAKRMFEAVSQFDKISPFDFETSARGAQQLLATFGAESAGQIIPMMTAIGNAVAASGGGTEEFMRVVRAFRQIQTNGKAMREEMNQIAETGIDPYKALRAELGLTEEQVKNLGDQGLAASVVLPALMRFWNRTFGSGMADQMNTINGQMSVFRGNVQQLSKSIGDSLEPAVVGVLKQLNEFLATLNKLPEPVKQAIGVGMAVGSAGLGIAGVASTFAPLVTAWQLSKLAKGGSVGTAAATGQVVEQLINGQWVPMGKGGRRGMSFGKRAGIGAGLFGAGLAAEAFLPDEGPMGRLGNIGAGALSGAGLGMLAGPKGALIGAILGGAFGAFQGTGSPQATPEQKTQEEMVTKLEQVVRNQERQIALAKGEALDTKVVPGAHQAAAWAFSKSIA